MKTSWILRLQTGGRRFAALGTLAVLCSLPATAFALPNAPWDDPSDDKDVLVKGVTAGDYMDGKKAPNGFLRDTLTQGHVDYWMIVFEWTFELKMTPAERAEFAKRLSAVWFEAPTQSQAPGVFRVCEHRSAADTYSPNFLTDRWGHTRTRNEQLIALRQAARADKVNGPWLLGVYDHHHPALAKGEPRLTRLSTNALTDRVVWMINEVVGKPAASSTPQLRERIAKQTAAIWPRLTPARRAELLKMEQDFHYMQQEGWKWKTEATREDMRIAWGAELVSSFPAIKPMYLLRKKRLETARRQSAARWAKMSPQEKQLALMSLQNQMQMNQQMINTMNNMRVQNHVTNMNIIENMKTTPQFVYSVR